MLLHWTDDFKAYWCSSTRIFDFCITLLCILPHIFDYAMDSFLEQPMRSMIQNPDCPFIKFDGTLIDLRQRFEHGYEKDVLLYSILYRTRYPDSTVFLGDTRGRFCADGVLDPSFKTQRSSVWNYFCVTSSTTPTNNGCLFSYQFLLALRVCRIMKIIMGNEKVRSIVVSIRKGRVPSKIEFSLRLNEIS